ncbi:MAG: hypothetical protein IID18_04110 [Nitrospinae bacterium]|nr:hypothetical protein [Nitrospinota bacterium]
MMSASPPISPDVISKAMGDLSANVATISGIPDAIKDAVSQSGLQGREIDPTKEYFADKPPVTAASLGSRAPSAEGGSKNSVAENLQILAAAGKGLADMAGNFSAPGATPGNAAASEPPANTDAPEKTEEPATPPETPPASANTETESPGKSWGTGQKRFAFVLIFLAGAALLHFYWKKKGKSSKKNDANLKKKYDKAHQLGWEENFQMAQNVLNEILKDYPKELDARFYLAGILWRKLNEPEEALEEYKKLEREVARQAVDYRYEDELKQNMEQLTEEIFQKSGVS